MNDLEAKDFIKKLYTGNACYHSGHIRIFAIYGDYVLVHHKTHSYYQNMKDGNSTCKSWYALVHSSQDKGRDWIFDSVRNAVLYFEGRINKERKAEIEERVKKPYEKR